MGLKYLPKIWLQFMANVGKYYSPMEHMGLQLKRLKTRKPTTRNSQTEHRLRSFWCLVR